MSKNNKVNNNSIVGKSAKHLTAKNQLNFLRGLLESFGQLEERVTNLEDTKRISGAQEYKIHSLGNKSAVKALGGKDSKAYKKMNRKVFASLWGEFRRYFDIPRYNELPAEQYKEAVEFVSTWQPKQELKMNIRELNSNAGE